MIFHASLPADQPDRVAGVIAELWGGESFRFPPWPGAYVAMAGDDRGSTVEVYPRHQVITPGTGDAQAHPTLDASPARASCFHLAIASPRSAEDILAIGEREGWRVLRCSRGRFFEVIELWLENSTLVEVLTADMQASYRRSINLETWRPRDTGR